jgi:hypothetical protein
MHLQLFFPLGYILHPLPGGEIGAEKLKTTFNYCLEFRRGKHRLQKAKTHT